jgi:OOP family OmpA-OmpF porin
MRSRIVAFALGCTLASATRDHPARATECTNTPSPCINDDTLWPHAGAARFAAIGSTETVASGQLGFALVSSYLSRPIVFKSPTPGSGGSSAYAVNDQVNGTFLWSYGATDRLELDVALPITYGQGGAGLQPITGGAALKDTAVRDMRFGFAYALVPHRRAAPDLPIGSALAPASNAWGLAARFEVSAPTGDHDEFAGERSGVFVPSLAADYRNGRLFAGAEIGARVRPITELLGARVGTQIVTMLGMGYDIVPRELLTATIEAWALPTLASQPSGPSGQSESLVPAEWQLSARTAPLRGGDLSIQLGGGGGLPLGDSEFARPRFRFTLGVRWAPMARDTDGDGIVDAVDKCPTTRAPGTLDGCPADPGAEPK